jgi:hypothetical protein
MHWVIVPVAAHRHQVQLVERRTRHRPGMICSMMKPRYVFIALLQVSVGLTSPGGPLGGTAFGGSGLVALRESLLGAFPLSVMRI